MGEKDTILSVSDLSIVKGKKKILKKISFQVKKGEVLALVGPNGSGKSTLAYILMGLKGYEPSGGTVIFKGKDITRAPVHERAKAGLILGWQEPARYEGITVRRFLALGLEGRGKGVTEDKLKWALKQTGLFPEKYMERKVDNTLSGGERKRLELSSIILMEPEMVILDEPDSGVDAVAINNITGVINNLKESGVGILVITHSDEILNLADEALLICNGTIIKKGSPKEIGKFFVDKCLPCSDDEFPKEVGLIE